MKFRKIAFSLFVILIFAFNTNLNTYAMNTGFDTQDVYPEVKQTFLSDIDLYLLSNEVQIDSICCFDVNNNGLIALGCDASDSKIIGIYDKDGNWKYGYSFNCYGSFGIEWDNDNLIIYFVRSDMAALFDKNGLCIELKEIKNTIENNSYWNHSVFSEYREINGDQYIIKNDMGFFNIIAFSYSQVICIDKNEKETVIVDVTDRYLPKIIVMFFLIAIFIIVTLLCLILYLKKYMKTKAIV